MISDIAVFDMFASQNAYDYWQRHRCNCGKATTNK